MAKGNISKIILEMKKGLIKHSPEILTGIGIAGMITTTIIAVKATPTALERLNDIKNSNMNDDKKALAKAVIKEVVPVYIPAAITGVTATACIIGATSVNCKRNAALATAYSISETALREYKGKVIETIGEKKEKAIRDEIAQDKIDKNPVKNNEVIITGKGDTRFYDAVSGRYFMSTIEKMRKVENILNKRMMTENYLALNELNYEVGLPCTKQGNELGFNIEDGLIEFAFSAVIGEDDEPVIVVDYNVAPRYGFDRFS